MLHWLDPGINSESVADNGWVDARHVSGSQREHVQIVGKEFLEQDLLVVGSLVLIRKTHSGCKGLHEIA